MDLGYVIRRAWQITWQHKALWLFGFLVGLELAMVGARLGVSGIQWERAVQELPPDVQRPTVDFLDSSYVGVAAAAFAVVGFLISVGLALLGALGRTALVNQVRSAEDYDVVILKGGWRAGKRHLWRVFFIRLLLGLPVAVVTLTSVLPIVATRLLTAGHERLEVVLVGVLAIQFLSLACFAPALCLVALLSIPLGVLRRLSVRACVLEGLGVRGSITRAWVMLREYVGALALTWLALTGIGIGVILLIGLPLVLLVVSLLTVVWLILFISPLLSVALVLVIGLLTWLVVTAAGGVVETFFSAAWTLAYRELIGMGRTGEETALAA
jgi:hypothetical protein